MPTTAPRTDAHLHPSKRVRALRRQVAPILRAHGVRKAAVFGSFARGTMTAASDLDILVEFERGKSLFDLVGLKLALEARTGRRVDIVTYRALHPMLREQILAEQIPLYDSKHSALPPRHSGKH